MKAALRSSIGINAASVRVRSSSIRVLQALAAALLTALPSWNALGDPATADQARSVVQGWLRAEKAPLQAKLGQAVQRVDTYNDAAGAPLYHVVSLSPNGFVIVAADDYVEPVIAFSSGGTFDPSTSNPLGAMVSKDLPNRLAKVKGMQRSKALSVHLSARDKWNQLSANAANQTSSGAFKSNDTGAGAPSNSVSDLRIAPLVQTTWDQSLDTDGGNACYNYYTPPYGAGNANNYVCGCVATAMAQLMRFWQYPRTGVGTGSYWIYINSSGTQKQLLGGDTAGGAYTWTNMVLCPSSGTTLAQRMAIGALCSDAGVSLGSNPGVSVDMNYGPLPGGSGADLGLAAAAFKNVFHYSNAIQGGSFFNYTQVSSDTLLGMVNPNLDAGCPVLFAISGTSGGHAIVCDGYGYNAQTLYHHLNMGWSGQDNVWYTLGDINTKGGTTPNFAYLDGCVYNVWTNGTGEIISGRITDGHTNGIANLTVTATRSGGGTYTATTDSHGIYAFAGIPSTSTYTLSVSNYGAYTGLTNLTIVTGTSQDYPGTPGNYWGANFKAALDSNDPYSLSATPVTPSRIDLSWAKDGNNDNVMVAWSTNAVFGIPVAGVSYAVGTTIPGGGTVLSNNGATSLSHTGRLHNTTYYYKAWSVRTGTIYSSGLLVSANTYAGVPFWDGFETPGAATYSSDFDESLPSMPNGWTQTSFLGNQTWWCQTTPWFTGCPGPYDGSYCAMLQDAVQDETKTYLVMPMLMFDGATNAQLSFYCCKPTYWENLDVYYKTNATSGWISLASYDGVAVSNWTHVTLTLTNLNNSYYIAFDGDVGGGYGVYLDDVSVTASGGNKADQTITFPAIPDQTINATVALTATASSGLPVSYSASGGPGLISGTNLICLGWPGTVAVVASQSGDTTNWNAAPSVTNYVTVNRGSLTSQTITFTTPSPQITTNIVTLSGSASSALPVTYTNISGPGSINGNTLTFTGVGTVVVVAYQGGNGSWYAATPVTNTIVVNYATATVTLTPATLNQTYNGSPCVVTATTVPSGLTTTITYNGSGTAPTSVGSYAVIGTVVSPLYQGSASGTLVVSKANQTITFAQIPNQLTNTTYTFTPATIVPSVLTISYAVVSGGSIATLTSGTTLQFNSTTGSVSVAASQAGNGNYNAATSVTNTFLVTNAVAQGAHTYYVATNGSDVANGLTWATAKQTIQAAVDLTAAGDSVLVSNGVYATGGRLIPSSSLTNRVAITNAITVQSVNGTGKTIISGAINSSTATNGDAAVRCVYFGANAVLSGFTLSNGHTRTGLPNTTDMRGGAVYCDTVSGVISNCILTGSSCYSWGGAAEGGTLIDCLITGNWAGNGGGGADSSTLINCTIAGNAGPTGSGTEGGTLENCIVYANTGGGVNFDSGSLNSCCTTPAPGSGTGNITSDPQFVNAAGGNFHLQATSPCIGMGSTTYLSSGMDLDGNPRVVNGKIDMGAYEWIAVTSTVTVAAIGGGTASGGGSYQAGSSIGISATATGSHWFFSQWNDGNTSASRTIIVPLTNITYTATFTQTLAALTFYVATNGSDAADGHSWATAKQTIQGGVDQTLAGDSVLVSNGVYATGGGIAPSLSESNRVLITKNITVQSVNGAAVTSIKGVNGGGYTLSDSVRCVFINAGSLSGFTLTNGCASSTSWDDCGGGVNCGCTGSMSGSAGAGGTASNCIIVGCSAHYAGGGAAYGTLVNCLVIGNTTMGDDGGGSYNANMVNCTVARNTASTYGGTTGGTLNNCIVYSNSPSGSANYSGTIFNYSCTTPAPGSGTGNVSSDPQFVNAAAGNFHLQATSPCHNQGSTTYLSSGTDLDGNPRVVNGNIDMGAYEYQGGGSYLLTSSYGAGGTVTPASTNVTAGGSAVFSIQGNTYYRIATLTTNGVSVGAFNNGSTSTNFTWSNVQAAGTVYAGFTDQVTSDSGHPTYTWLAAHGLATDTNCTNGSCSDTDHDGMTAWQEYLAGTDPTSASSVLSFRSIASTNGSSVLQWSSSASARAPYNVLYSTNLMSGIWTLYTNKIAATPPTNSLVVPSLGNNVELFYKVTITN